VDLKKAFDTVSRKAMVLVLRSSSSSPGPRRLRADEDAPPQAYASSASCLMKATISTTTLYYVFHQHTRCARRTLLMRAIDPDQHDPQLNNEAWVTFTVTFTVTNFRFLGLTDVVSCRRFAARTPAPLA
jgi:hypothetical protein